MFTGFVVASLGVEVAISCLASRSANTASVTRQRSSVTSKVFVQVEANSNWSILSTREGLGCSWGVELGRESRRVSVALGATCGLACNIVF